MAAVRRAGTGEPWSPALPLRRLAGLRRSRDPGLIRPNPEAGPGTVVLRRGDSVYEQTGMVHHAKATGTDPTVILIAALFTTGQELSINVNV